VFETFIKACEIEEWYPLDGFRQIYECRMIIIYLPSELAIPYFQSGLSVS